MILVAIAWLYVVGMMALAEATSPNGSVLGAVFTLLLYGLGPLAIVMYILGTPARRAARRAAEAAEAPPPQAVPAVVPQAVPAVVPQAVPVVAPLAPPASAAPDGRGEAAGAAVAPEREEAR